MSRAVLSVIALVATSGCNLIFGLEEPTLAGAGGDTNTGAGSTGGEGAGASDGGSGAATSDGGGGGGATCPDSCPDDCFEGACDGQTPVELAPGSQVSCARLKSGSVWCFGSNRFAGLGLPPNDAPETCKTSSFGDTIPCSYEGLRVDLPDKARSISVGWHAACAALDNGEVWCWGANERGLLGHVPDESDDICDGQRCRTAPVRVEGLPTATAVNVGDTHACAVVEGGAWCWGLNHAGQLGNGEVVFSDVAVGIDPAQVTPPGPVNAAFAGNSVYSLSLSADHTCASDSQKHVWCWGSNTYGQTGPVAKGCSGFCAEPLPLLSPDIVLTNALALVTPRAATCFVADGTSEVRCRGWNGWGSLGKTWDGDVHEQPMVVAESEGATTLAASDTHICLLASDGEVKCWGTDFSGQLGDGTPDGAPDICAYGLHCEATPKSVAGVAATQVAAGNLITMVITQDDGVVGWGINQTALLGYEPDTGTDELCAYYDTTLDDILCTATPSVVGGLPD